MYIVLASYPCHKKLHKLRNSLAVLWLGLRTSTAGGTGSILGRGTQISHATRPKKKKLIKKKINDNFSLKKKIIQTWWFEQSQVYYLLQFHRLEVRYRSLWAKIRVSAGLHSFWRLQREIYFLAFSSFQRPPTLLHSQFLPPSSKPTTLLLSDDSSVIISPSDSSASVFHFKDLCDYNPE